MHQDIEWDDISGMAHQSGVMPVHAGCTLETSHSRAKKRALIRFARLIIEDAKARGKLSETERNSE